MIIINKMELIIKIFKNKIKLLIIWLRIMEKMNKLMLRLIILFKEKTYDIQVFLNNTILIKK